MKSGRKNSTIKCKEEVPSEKLRNVETQFRKSHYGGKGDMVTEKGKRQAHSGSAGGKRIPTTTTLESKRAQISCTLATELKTWSFKRQHAWLWESSEDIREEKGGKTSIDI